MSGYTHSGALVRGMKFPSIFRGLLPSLGWLFPIVVLLMVRSVVPWQERLQPLLEWLGKSGGWGMVLAVLLYLPLGLMLVPASALTILVGLAHGFWGGLLCVTVGANGAAWAAFGLARLFRVGAKPKINANNRLMARINESGERWAFWMVTLARLSVFVPYGPLNYLLGFTRIRFTDYALGTFLGMLPGSALYLWAGTALAADSGTATASNILMVVGLVSLSLLLALVGGIATRAILEEGGQPPQPAPPIQNSANGVDQAGSGAASNSAITTS